METSKKHMDKEKYCHWVTKNKCYVIKRNHLYITETTSSLSFSLVRRASNKACENAHARLLAVYLYIKLDQ